MRAACRQNASSAGIDRKRPVNTCCGQFSFSHLDDEHVNLIVMLAADMLMTTKSNDVDPDEHGDEDEDYGDHRDDGDGDVDDDGDDDDADVASDEGQDEDADGDDDVVDDDVEGNDDDDDDVDEEEAGC